MIMVAELKSWCWANRVSCWPSGCLGFCDDGVHGNVCNADRLRRIPQQLRFLQVWFSDIWGDEPISCAWRSKVLGWREMELLIGSQPAPPRGTDWTFSAAVMLRSRTTRKFLLSH